VLTLSEIKALSERTLLVRDQFEDPGDQGFINYWVDDSDLKVQAVSEVMPDVYDWNWAGSTLSTGRRDMFEVADKTGVFEGKRFAMIHWAGFGLVSYMPNRELFLKYRLAHASSGERLYYEWAWSVRPIFGNAKRQLQARLAG
jgi:hypothetical protein